MPYHRVRKDAARFETDLLVVVSEWLRERGWDVQSTYRDPVVAIHADGNYCFCGCNIKGHYIIWVGGIWSDDMPVANIPVSNPTFLEDLENEINKAIQMEAARKRGAKS